MSIARARTVRDAILVLVGALAMHILTSFFGVFQPDIYSGDIILNTQVNQQPLADPYAVEEHHIPTPPKRPQSDVDKLDLARQLPETTMLSHAPGWTVFKNIYMSNDIQYITSTGLYAENTPENIAARMPTKREISFITPEQARLRWGPPRSQQQSKTAHNRVYNVQGTTFIFNDPDQFLNHYYHFCAELWLGAWAMWQGTNHIEVPPESASEMTAPSIDRIIFPHTDGEGWRDKPGFNSYFLRAAFPSITVEVDVDWDDRVAATSAAGEHARAWHFDTLLLADRSAAFRGVICGAQVHRTAAEAFYAMKTDGRLSKWWWEPVRRAVLKFANVEPRALEIGTRVEKAELDKINPYAADVSVPEGSDRNAEMKAKFAKKEKIVISYIDRQGVRRHLIDENHEYLVRELKKLADTNGYELNIIRAETLTKEQQLAIVARTTIMIGVHGNGLSHLIMMSPTSISTVIELFYPGGFAHDYEWTARALGHKHFAVWNDTYHTHPTLPWVAYPEGFQGTQIPVHAPTVINIIEERIAGRLR